MEDQAIRRRSLSKAPKTVFDDPETMLALVTTSFELAAREALAENDRLGIVTHGTESGQDSRIAERKPASAHKVTEKIGSARER